MYRPPGVTGTVRGTIDAACVPAVETSLRRLVNNENIEKK